MRWKNRSLCTKENVSRFIHHTLDSLQTKTKVSFVTMLRLCKFLIKTILQTLCNDSWKVVDNFSCFARSQPAWKLGDFDLMNNNQTSACKVHWKREKNNLAQLSLEVCFYFPFKIVVKNKIFNARYRFEQCNACTQLTLSCIEAWKYLIMWV